MQENEMRDYIELFWDEAEPIYSYWDERTENKKLLCASHDEATVFRYVLQSPISTLQQKEDALRALDSLAKEEEADEARFILSFTWNDEGAVRQVSDFDALVKRHGELREKLSRETRGMTDAQYWELFQYSDEAQELMDIGSTLRVLNPEWASKSQERGRRTEEQKVR